MPQRQRYLFVCTNQRDPENPRGSCAERGSEAVHQALKEELATCGLNKLQARVCRSSCLDQCTHGVTVLVEPDHFFYGHVTVADVPEIAQSLRDGRRIDRLLLGDAQLADG